MLPGFIRNQSIRNSRLNEHDIGYYEMLWSLCWSPYALISQKVWVNSDLKSNLPTLRFPKRRLNFFGHKARNMKWKGNKDIINFLFKNEKKFVCCCKNTDQENNASIIAKQTKPRCLVTLFSDSIRFIIRLKMNQKLEQSQAIFSDGLHEEPI